MSLEITLRNENDEWYFDDLPEHYNVNYLCKYLDDYFLIVSDFPDYSEEIAFVEEEIEQIKIDNTFFNRILSKISGKKTFKQLELDLLKDLKEYKIKQDTSMYHVFKGNETLIQAKDVVFSQDLNINTLSLHFKMNNERQTDLYLPLDFDKKMKYYLSPMIVQGSFDYVLEVLINNGVYI